MVRVCFTFDYELFFGNNNGTYNEVLFEHTYDLIDKLEKMGIMATFFADVCSIPIAKKFNQNDYLEGFKAQICYMIKHGQDVQLHLHPHWYNAKMQENQWEFNDKGYRLHDFKNQDCVKKIVDDGINFLNDTLKPIKNDYKCIAFRAGGFSLQPHNELIGLLYDRGIRIDSSIAPHLFAHNNAQYYDYRHKIKHMNWHISENAEWWKDCSEGRYMIEIPIATIDKAPLPFLLRRIIAPNTIKLGLGEKRGTYMPIVQSNKMSRLKTYFSYLTGYNAVSLDAYSAEYLYSQLKRISRRECYNNQTIAIIGHPKLVTNKYIKNMENFIQLIQKDSRFEIVSMCQIV